MSQSLANNRIKITYLTGFMEFKEPEWSIKRIDDKTSVMGTEFCTITGETHLLVRAAIAVGIRPRIIK